MKTKAELFAETLTDENNIKEMIYAISQCGGEEWGENSYKVEFQDNSYYSAAIFYPQDQPAYYNGSAKVNPMSVYKVLGSAGDNIVVRLPDGRKVQTTRANYFDPAIHVKGDHCGTETNIVVNWVNP